MVGDVRKVNISKKRNSACFTPSIKERLQPLREKRKRSVSGFCTGEKRIPKVMDLFTGHEAKGKYVAEFTKMLTDHVYNEFHEMIEKYNGIMKKKSKDVSDVLGEFGLIEI